MAPPSDESLPIVTSDVEELLQHRRADDAPQNRPEQTADDPADARTDGRAGLRVLAVLARFLALESCGQCNACKLGTTAIHEHLDRIEAGHGDTDVLDAIVQRVPVITDQARCYLPTGAQLTVGSTLEHHWEEVVAHLGTTCDDDRPAPTPLIESIDTDTGEVTWHPTYDQPRP